MGFFKITVQYDASLVTVRSHNRIMNQLYREAMEHHKQVVLPRHFENVPETRPHSAYGYAPRSRRWKKRKAREGHDPERPLVYKGLMRTIVLRESVVRATKDHGTLTASNHYPMTAQRRKEVETLSDREVQRIAGRMQIDYVKKANSPEFARQRGPRKVTP